MKEAREKPVFDVFLSHNSKDKPAVRALAALLTERDIRVWLDEEQMIPGKPWQPLLQEGINKSATGAVLVGADGVGPWENEEMQALLQFALEEKKPVIPVLLPGASERPDLPAFLSNRKWVDLRKGFQKDELTELIWGITGRKPDVQTSSQPVHGLEVAVTRLRHGADTLVGREKELAQLDAAWEDPKTHVVTIVAWGGVGKTALVVEWMARMARDGWRGAERVFDWSFYSQGTREQGAASADAFVASALEFFRDPLMAQSAASPWDKGERLAQLVANRKTVLILDGVEPLQYPPGPVGGKLKDPALEALLKGLAQHNPGLCIVTTREPIMDLAPFRTTTAPEWHLEHLSEEAGAYLLFNEGVRRAGKAGIEAHDPELKAATREVGGHALTLQLLGRYLARAHDGDVRKRALVAFGKADVKVQGSHAFHMMAAYEKWLGEAGEEGQRQLAVLHLLGLFDRPADLGCITALRKEPAIVRLTEPLMSIEDEDWNCTLSNLRECGLITVRADESAIDCHPLVREYFARQLRENAPKAWQAAHRRLYEYLTQSTEHWPDTLANLQPLYQAVAHGCQAAMCQRTVKDVYHDRILRGDKWYSSKMLGAFGADLGALACFFDHPWSKPSAKVSAGIQAWLLNEAAFSLRAMGRLTEAVEPTRVSLDMCVEQGNWREAAIRDGNLSELELVLGEVSAAIADAKRSVELADRGGDSFLRMYQRTTWADSLHQAGRREEARAILREAETMQAERQPQYPLLCSLQGFRYREMLLALAERAAWQRILNLQLKVEMSDALAACDNVRRQVEEVFGWHMPSNPLDTALDYLSLGRADLYRAILEYRPRGTSQESLDRAVASLRCAGVMDYLCRGLLSRVLLRFLDGDSTGSRADLEEAREIAERGPMPLLQADIHLTRGRLSCNRGELRLARQLIENHGFYRRNEELADAETASGGWGTVDPSADRRKGASQ